MYACRTLIGHYVTHAKLARVITVSIIASLTVIANLAGCYILIVLFFNGSTFLSFYFFPPSLTPRFSESLSVNHLPFKLKYILGLSLES
ncbi:hypothetical protein S83_059536 [Arachis hypogaea]